MHPEAKQISSFSLAVFLTTALFGCSSGERTTTIAASQGLSTPEDTAPGLQLVELDAFQVVAIPLLDNSVGVPDSERIAPLVANRMAVVRAKVIVPTGWTTDDVELRIDVTVAGETTQLRSNSVVEDSSDLANPDSGLFIDLPANLMQPAATYVVSLWKPGSSLPSARFPLIGEAELAPQITGPVKVHIVPYRVEGLVPDTSQAALNDYRDTIFAYYPTNEVTVTLGEVQENPSPEADSSDVIGSVLVDVGMLMESDTEQAPIDTYYYALVTVPGNREGFQGSTGSSQELEYRAGFAAGVSFSDDPLNSSTLAHELGHLHFLRHAPCGSPDESSLDAFFPFENGMANIEGYDARTGTFSAKDSSGDLMSYCRPRWVSAYNYVKMANWIQNTQNWTE